MRAWLALAIALGGCQRREAAPTAEHRRDAIPRAVGAIKIDGDWDEPDWAKQAFRGQLRGADGALARPSSEVRLLHDGDHLLVALYAADEDIRSTDAFDLAVGTLALHVDARARLTPVVPGVRAAAGYDEGTVDNPNDDDEEWVVELEIPLALVGLSSSSKQVVRVDRCDIPKDGIRRCASWTATLSLE
jgi:hypothetical protein